MLLNKTFYNAILDPRVEEGAYLLKEMFKVHRKHQVRNWANIRTQITRMKKNRI